MNNLTKILLVVLLAVTILTAATTKLVINVDSTQTTLVQALPDHNVLCKTVQNNKECVVVMGRELKGVRSVANILALLDTAKSGDKITFLITGLGGEVDTLLAITHEIESTKADVTTKVIGDVYSAHAMLGLVGKHIILKPSAVIMYHHSSGLRDRLEGNDVCAAQETKARRESCTKYINKHIITLDIFLQTYVYKYLTIDEIKQIREGGEVYLTGAELSKRINK